MSKVSIKALRELVDTAKEMPSTHDNFTKSLLIEAIIETADYIEELENKIEKLEEKSKCDDKQIEMMAERIKKFWERLLFNK